MCSPGISEVDTEEHWWVGGVANGLIFLSIAYVLREMETTLIEIPYHSPFVVIARHCTASRMPPLHAFIRDCAPSLPVLYTSTLIAGHIIPHYGSV